MAFSLPALQALISLLGVVHLKPPLYWVGKALVSLDSASSWPKDEQDYTGEWELFTPNEVGLVALLCSYVAT